MVIVVVDEQRRRLGIGVRVRMASMRVCRDATARENHGAEQIDGDAGSGDGHELHGVARQNRRGRDEMRNGLEKNVHAERQQKAQVGKAAQELRSAKTKRERVARGALALRDAIGSAKRYQSMSQVGKWNANRERNRANVAKITHRDHVGHIVKRIGHQCQRAQADCQRQLSHTIDVVNAVDTANATPFIVVCWRLTRCARPDARS
jgi:hypothetical protein